MHQAELRDSRDIRLRQGIGHQSLSGEKGVRVDVPLGKLPKVFTGAPCELGRLPFKSRGSGVIDVLMHGRWRKV